jgi:hypothetical protein
METIFVSYPYPNRGILHGLAGIGFPLSSLHVAHDVYFVYELTMRKVKFCP